MSHYVRTRIYRRTLILWNPYKSLLRNVTDEWEKAMDAVYFPRLEEILSREKNKIKMQQKLCLDYLGISDKKLLNQLIKHEFNKFLDILDKTEEAIKSNKKIY